MPISFQKIESCPDSQPFAECHGIDLSLPVSSADLSEIKAGLMKHGLLVFPKQKSMQPRDEVRFNEAFGWHDKTQKEFLFGFGAPSSEHKVSGGAQIPEHPQVSVLGNVFLENYHGITNTQLVPVLGLSYSGWHADGLHDMFDGMPELTTMYKPTGWQTQHGGKTLFTSGVAAVESMNPELLSELEQCTVGYVRCPNDDATDESRRVVPGPVFMDSEGTRRVGFAVDANDPVKGFHDFQIELQHADGGGRHRCIRTHPVTGQRSLYLTPSRSVCLFDLATGAVRHDVETTVSMLCEALYPGVTKDVRYEHAWEEGDFVAWSNTLVLHSASDASGIVGDRLIHRVRLSTPKTRWINGRYTSD
ncbi:MAG: alpha-ketoglutarate-dependent taurine dioxygenase [Gammaproteobacteria bacterium]|jgi:alpha-ketoglutarate-dependent taurine dioxygenase